MHIRTTFLALLFLASTNAIASWQPYTINPENVDAAIAKLTPGKWPHNELTEAKKLALRSIAEGKLPILVAKELAIIAGSKYRKPSTYPKLAVKTDNETWKDVMDRFVSYAKKEWGDEAEQKIEGLTQEALQIEQRLKDMCQSYQEWIATAGLWNLDPFMTIVDSVMGISPNVQEKFEAVGNRQTIFEVMKATGFICTELQDLSAYSYNPGTCVATYFAENPQTNALVIGCGHYMPRSYEICNGLQINWEATSGACDEAPHKDALTLAYERGYQADLLADMYDARLWAGIQGRLEVIEDHTEVSLGFEFDQVKLKDFLKYVRGALKPEGLFFIQAHEDAEKEKPFAQILNSGFKYLGYDKTKQALKFGKQ